MRYNGLVLTTGERLAGIRLVYVVEGVWVAALQQCVGCGHADQHRLATATLDVRARSQRSHECARPVAERSASHAAVDGQRGRAANRVRAHGQPSAFSGKPWTAAAQIALPQGAQRVLLEPRGSRRLSSQTLLDLRLSWRIASGKLGRMDLLLDVLNLLNETAEESLATETQMTETVFSPTFGQPVSFVDPRRAMLGVRLNLGR